MAVGGAQGVDHGAGHVVKGLGAARAEVEDAAFLGVVEVPQVDRHHVVHKHKVAHLRASCVAAVFTKQLNPALGPKLVELVVSHAGHAALVLLVRAVDVEIPKTHHLRARVLQLGAKLAAHHLVKQQFGVAVDIERRFKSRVFFEGGRAAIGGCRRRVQKPRALRLRGVEELLGRLEVVLHHVLAVKFHGVAASAFVEDGFHMAVALGSKGAVKSVGVYIVGNFEAGQVAKLVALGELVHRNDVVNATGVEPGNDLAANKAGSAGNHNARHANNSW